MTYLHGDLSQVNGILKSEHSSVPIIDPSTGEVLLKEHPKTSPDQILVHGISEAGTVASVVMKSGKASADKVGTRWYITGTEGEIVVTTEEGLWQYASPSTRSIRVCVGRSGVPQEIDFSSGDLSRGSKLPFPSPNTCRIYENFASEGGEVVTFEEALKLHRLLDRIAESAGWV